MTLYELNQAGYASIPKMTRAELETARNKVAQYLDEKNSKYYMMINHDDDMNYYTLYTYKGEHNPIAMANEMMDVAKTLGKLKAIEMSENGYIEFWIQSSLDNVCRAYLVFNYEEGVIEV